MLAEDAVRRPRFGFFLAAALALLSAAGEAGPASGAQRRSLSTVTYPPGWNLVGGPAGTRLSGVTGSLYTLQYRDQGYEALQPARGLTGGLGYWAYFPSGGTAMLPDGGPCVIAVPIGAGSWVQVGDPWPTGTATIKGVERVVRYDPQNGYVTGPSIKAGQGAWAYSSVATSVAVVVDGCPTADSVPPSPPVVP
jgi:hypothetical protein